MPWAMTDVRERLSQELVAASWTDLEPHLSRGALFVVESPLELMRVGVAVVEDDAAQVAQWLEQGGLRRPTEDELARWPADKSVIFATLICQPYVLCQPGQLVEE